MEIEKQIRDIVSTLGGPNFVEQWFNQPLPSFDNQTPRKVIDQGEGQKLLEKLAGVSQERKRGVKK